MPSFSFCCAVDCVAVAVVPCVLLLCAVFGGCDHPFHMHCIVKWLKSQQSGQEQCPLCRAEWTFKES